MSSGGERSRFGVGSDDRTWPPRTASAKQGRALRRLVFRCQNESAGGSLRPSTVRCTGKRKVGWRGRCISSRVLRLNSPAQGYRAVGGFNVTRIARWRCSRLRAFPSQPEGRGLWDSQDMGRRAMSRSSARREPRADNQGVAIDTVSFFMRRTAKHCNERHRRTRDGLITRTTGDAFIGR